MNWIPWVSLGWYVGQVAKTTCRGHVAVQLDKLWALRGTKHLDQNRMVRRIRLWTRQAIRVWVVSGMFDLNLVEKNGISARCRWRTVYEYAGCEPGNNPCWLKGPVLSVHCRILRPRMTFAFIRKRLMLSRHITKQSQETHNGVNLVLASYVEEPYVCNDHIPREWPGIVEGSLCKMRIQTFRVHSECLPAK